MSFARAIFFAFLAFSGCINVLADVAPNIVTKYGSIAGFSDSYANMYLGIPYAMPPVNDLRWEEPLEARPWIPNILNATSFKSACPQPDCASRMPKATCPTTVK